MALGVTVRVRNLGEFVKTLEAMSPKQNRRWVVEALKDSAVLVQRLARSKYIIRGGRFRGPAGPRGGKGKLRDRPADRTRLTSRSNRLRDSIAINNKGLPRFITVETDMDYAAIHEFGGTIRISEKMRRVLHAKGIHPRKTTTQIKMPKRPYMAPALEEASESMDDIFVRRWNRAISR